MLQCIETQKVCFTVKYYKRILVELYIYFYIFLYHCRAYCLLIASHMCILYKCTHICFIGKEFCIKMFNYWLFVMGGLKILVIENSLHMVWYICSMKCHSNSKLSTQTSFNWWMDELILVYPHSGILLRNQKLPAMDECHIMDETQMRGAKWNKLDPKATYCVILFMTFRTDQCRCRSRGRGWLRRGSGRAFGGSGRTALGVDYGVMVTGTYVCVDAQKKVISLNVKEKFSKNISWRRTQSTISVRHRTCSCVPYDPIV